MRINRRQLVTATFSLISSGMTFPDSEFHFRAGGFEWEMKLQYYDWPSVNRLNFRDRTTGRQFCVLDGEYAAGNCKASFVGSIGVARYRITKEGVTKLPRLLERVRTIDKCDNMPERPPFESAIEWENGLASDIQAFGLSGQGAAEGGDSWCIVRQELYLEDELQTDSGSRGTPVVILHWKHTLKKVRLLDVIARSGRPLE